MSSWLLLALTPEVIQEQAWVLRHWGIRGKLAAQIWGYCARLDLMLPMTGEISLL